MNKPSDFLPVTVSMRRGELALLDTATKALDVTRSEFVRSTTLAAARAVLTPPTGEEGES